MVKLLRRWRARLIALQPLVQRDFSLRARFAAFTLTVCFAIVAVFVVDAIHERDVATSVARTAAENLAESLAQQASDTFDADSGALRSIAQQVRRQGIGERARLDLRDTMAALTSAMPRIQLLAVFDERGRIIASNLSAHPVGLPTIADRT